MTSQALTRTSNERTILDIPVDGDPWPIVEAWAPGAGFQLKQSNGNRRLYQKGSGFWVAPMMLELVLDGPKLTLSAWVHATLFVRIFALFLIPAEMNINSGGFRMVLPRNIARGKINELLGKLGTAPIP
jgi:hypothetical protein